MKYIKVILLIFVTSYSFACSCLYTPPEFNLFQYDLAKSIHEYKVISEIKYIDTGEIPIPEFSRDFKIEILNTFKGVSKNIYDTLVLENYSSCSIFPEIGETYISYSASDLPSYASCQRKLIKGSKYFKNEKNILLLLKSPLVEKNISTTFNKKIIEGNFIYGERHGTWNIYYPISSYTEKQEQILFLQLTYHRGNLTNVKNYINKEYYNFHNDFNRYTESFYFELMNKKSSSIIKRLKAPKDDQF